MTPEQTKWLNRLLDEHGAAYSNHHAMNAVKSREEIHKFLQQIKEEKEAASTIDPLKPFYALLAALDADYQRLKESQGNESKQARACDDIIDHVSAFKATLKGGQ
jgi:hypothetical protein